MKSKPSKVGIIALVLIAATTAGVAAFPALQQAQATQKSPIEPPRGHSVEVVFILDTTGSMSGLIHAAKEKIWSIASSMASAQQNPDIRMGLVAYRDRGDAYVTRVFDLSGDLDSMYANLMDFRAQGGGDGPESVNQALHDAIHQISWSQGEQVYRTVFLVGDAPPHMDYPDDVKYPQTLAAAAQKGIVVNTIQSGQQPYTRPAWQQIAALGNGEYFQVENSGNAVAVSTPFDEELARLSSMLEETRLYYGDEETRAEQKAKLDAADRLHKELSPEALARRSAYNATAAGEKNFLGESELVDAVSSGRVELGSIAEDDLPASLQAMEPEEQMAEISERAQRRDELRQKIEQLSESRNRFIKKEIEAAGGADDSLDEKIYRAVRGQAASAGLTYESDSAKY